MNGIVKKKIDLKGFGFITPDGKSQDLFFHRDALVGVTFDEIQEGDKVTFEEKEGPKGMQADNVQRA